MPATNEISNDSADPTRSSIAARQSMVPGVGSAGSCGARFIISNNATNASRRRERHLDSQAPAQTPATAAQRSAAESANPRIEIADYPAGSRRTRHTPSRANVTQARSIPRQRGTRSSTRSAPTAAIFLTGQRNAIGDSSDSVKAAARTPGLRPRPCGCGHREQMPQALNRATPRSSLRRSKSDRPSPKPPRSHRRARAPHSWILGCIDRHRSAASIERCRSSQSGGGVECERPTATVRKASRAQPFEVSTTARKSYAPGAIGPARRPQHSAATRTRVPGVSMPASRYRERARSAEARSTPSTLCTSRRKRGPLSLASFETTQPSTRDRLFRSLETRLGDTPNSDLRRRGAQTGSGRHRT
jgi:hypothetical protein